MNTYNNSFVWTDDLVKEFTYDFYAGKYDKLPVGQSRLQEFIKSKQQPVEDKRIVISELSRANTFGENGFRYDFYTDKNIPQERYEAVKQAIERELNNEKPFSYDVKVSNPIMERQEVKEEPKPLFEEMSKLISDMKTILVKSKRFELASYVRDIEKKIQEILK